MKAQVADLPSLSAHADYVEILAWLGGCPKPPRHTYVVHGEPSAAQHLQAQIARELQWPSSVARYQEVVTL